MFVCLFQPQRNSSLKSLESLFNARLPEDTTPKLPGGRTFSVRGDAASVAVSSDDNKENVASLTTPQVQQLKAATRRGLFRSPSEPRLLLRKSYSMQEPVSSSPLLQTASERVAKLNASQRVAKLAASKRAAKSQKRPSDATSTNDVSSGGVGGGGGTQAQLRQTKRRRHTVTDDAATTATATATTSTAVASTASPTFSIDSGDSSSDSSSNSNDADELLARLRAAASPELLSRLRVPPPDLARSHSHSSEADIKSALSRLSEDPDLVGDMSRAYALPRCPCKHQDLKGISTHTVSHTSLLLLHT